MAEGYWTVKVKGFVIRDGAGDGLLDSADTLGRASVRGFDFLMMTWIMIKA